MNTTSELIEKLNEEIELFDSEHERVMIQMRIMSEVEKAMEEQNINYKKMSERTGISASFITQLFRGHKKLNIETIAKFQFVLNKKFSMKLMNYDELLQENMPTSYVKMKVSKTEYLEQKQMTA